MMEGMFSRGAIPVLDSLMQFAGARHRVIAANVANVDTMGYRALDLPVAGFERALAKAYAGQKASPTGLFRMPGPERFEPRPAEESGTLKGGGNNVDLDLEMARMVRNQSLHATAAALLAQQFSLLREAISGRVSA